MLAQRRLARALAVTVGAALLVTAAPWAAPAMATGSTIDTVQVQEEANNHYAFPTDGTIHVTLSGYSSTVAPNTVTLTGPSTLTGTITGTATTTSTTATFNVSAAALGNYDATLSFTSPAPGTPPQTQATCSSCFQVLPKPSITSFSPGAVLNNTSTTLTLTGSGFSNVQSIHLVHAGVSDLVGTSVHTTSSTSASAVFDLHAAAPYDDGYTVQLTNAVAGVASSTSSFSVGAAFAPSVTSIAPAGAPVGATNQTITVVGTGFAKGATVALPGGGVTVGSVTVSSLTQLSFTVTVAAGAATGARDLTITNVNADTVTCTGCFTISALPTVSSISPTTAGQGATGRSVTITGTGLQAGATVAFSKSSSTGTVTAGTSTGSVTTLTVPVTVSANATPGVWNLVVTNPDSGASTPAGLLTVVAGPTLGTPSPASKGQGTSATVTLTGTNFVSGATVDVTGSGVTLSAVTFVDSSHLTVGVTVAGNAAKGARTLTVTNPDGGAASTTFTVGQAPTFSAATPHSLGQGGSGSLSIDGTDFASGATVAFSKTGSNGSITAGASTGSGTTITVPVTVSSDATLGTWDITVTNPDGGSYLLPAAFTVNAPPAATTLSPSTAGQGVSGRTIVVAGTNFVAGMTAAFTGAGVTVDSISVGSATQATLQVTVASGAAATARGLILTNPDKGTSTLASALVIKSAPTVTSPSPVSRSQGATFTATLTGTGFQTGATVSFNKAGSTGSVTAGATTGSGTTIIVPVTVSSDATTGQWNITVTNLDGGVSPSGAVFTVDAPPTLTSTSPASVSNSGSPHSRSISFTGMRFIADPGAVLKLTMTGQPDVVATGVTVASATSASGTFVVEALKPGNWTPVLTNADGSTATCSCTVAVLGSAPTITSVSPGSAGEGAAARHVTISGTGFSNGTAVTFSGSGVTASNIVVVSATQITVDVAVASSAPTAARDLTVTNADTLTVTKAGAFAINSKPSVTSVSPNVLGANATHTGVAITGTGFVTGMSLDFGDPGVTVSNVVVTSATTATATIAVDLSAVPGSDAAKATNTDGGTSATAAALTVDSAPSITSISPSTLGSGASGQTVTITGADFLGTPTVAISGTGVTVSNVVNSGGTSLTLTVAVDPSAATSTRDLTVTNADGGLVTAVGGFHVKAAPVLTSMDTTSAPQGSSLTTVGLHGTGFQDGMTLSLGGGITVTNLVVSGLTAATADLAIASSAAATVRDAVLTNPDAGTTTSTSAFTVTAGPHLTADASPSAVQGVSGVTVTLTGTGFQNGLTVTLSKSGSTGTVTAGSATVAGNGLSLTVPVTASGDASTGQWDVTVTNPDTGANTRAAALTVDARPTLTSVSPGSRGQGSTSLGVALVGTGFQAGMTVSFGPGVVVSNTVVSGPTAATVDLAVSPSAATGARSVSVTNPDLGAASGSLFTVNAAPTVTSVSPVQVTGRTATVTVHGTGFTGTPTVAFASGLTHGTVTRVDATTLTVPVTVATTAAAGTSALSLTNGDGGRAACASCVSVVNATSLTILRSTGTITAGAKVTLSGVLRRTWTSAPLAGRVVTVYAKTAGTTAYQAVGTAITTSTGSWTKVLVPTKGASYFVQVTANATDALVSSGTLTVLVRWKPSVVSTALGIHVSGGRRVAIVGASYPNAYRATVDLMLRNSKGVLVVKATGVVGSDGKVHVTSTFATGTWVIAIRIRAYGANVAGASALYTLHVT